MNTISSGLELAHSQEPFLINHAELFLKGLAGIGILGAGIVCVAVCRLVETAVNIKNENKNT